jgi:hypothetical protein
MSGRNCKRLHDGDADLEPDEIRSAIDKAEQKRRELLDMQPAAKQSAKMISMLPKAADAYRRQIAEGLENDPRAAAKASAILRKLLGPINLIPEQRGLWAEYEIQPATCSRLSDQVVAGACFRNNLLQNSVCLLTIPRR